MAQECRYLRSNRFSTRAVCKVIHLCAVSALLFPICCGALGQSTPSVHAPLELSRVYELPMEVTGSFDHLEVDIKRNRLFVTSEDTKAVLVIDLDGGEVVHRIENVRRPHGVLYRADADRLYVTDGGDGAVKVYDGSSYQQITRIPLLRDADSIGFDISRKYLYVNSGGKDAGQSYSMLSAIDTNASNKISDFRIDADALEAMALDNYRPHIYVNDRSNNQVVVVDRYTNSLIARWPLLLGKQNVPMALDEQRQRLFVGCRSGEIVVLDSNTGKELQSLPIPTGIDDLIYDPGTRRIYAAANGSLAVYEQTDLNHYVSMGTVLTGTNARTARYIPQLDRIFVAVPASANDAARILAYQPVDVTQAKPVQNEPRQQVKASGAQRIVLETLSAHPLLRRMGLHAVPPGATDMVIIANANATRVGIHTSQSDFDAVAGGKIYGPRIADGEFYNLKMPLFDARNRRIGILVMEIACTDAASEEAAAREAAAIRDEVEKNIPSLESLFDTPGTN